MTTLTFEVSADLNAPAIAKGSHIAKIISAGIVTHNEEDQFCITWKIGDSALKDKFKLWANEETKRKYAGKKLNKLCEAVGVHFPSPKTGGGKVHFDASVLVGKSIRVFVEEFTNDKGEIFPYIESYAPATLDDVFNQEVPF
ncbi:MAG: hypothetical protein WCN27_04415 [Alphaproteobacteria bacterium]